MKRALFGLAALTMVAAMTPACAYGMIATSGKQVIVVRQDMFLLGALRKVYVCTISPNAGLTDCQNGMNP